MEDVMSIKLPGVGKKIDQYIYCVALDNKNNVCINIKYEKVNTYNIACKEQKIFEIRTDIRWPDVNKIVEVIKKHLEDGLNGKNVRIKEDKPRMYLWVEMDQFTGNSL